MLTKRLEARGETAPTAAIKTSEAAPVLSSPKSETTLEVEAGAQQSSKDERFQLSQAEQEILEIPTFLRRQAN